MKHHLLSASLATVLLTLAPIFTARGQTVERVDQFNPNGRGSGPYHLTSFQGDLFYQANSASVGRELMRFDGNSVTVAADSMVRTRAGYTSSMAIEQTSRGFLRLDLEAP